MSRLNQSLPWEGSKALTDSLRLEHPGRRGEVSSLKPRGSPTTSQGLLGSTKWKTDLRRPVCYPIFIWAAFSDLTLSQGCFPQTLHRVGDPLAAFQLSSAPRLQNLENQPQTNLSNSYPMKSSVSRFPIGNLDPTTPFPSTKGVTRKYLKEGCRWRKSNLDFHAQGCQSILAF